MYTVCDTMYCSVGIWVEDRDSDRLLRIWILDPTNFLLLASASGSRSIRRLIRIQDPDTHYSTTYADPQSTPLAIMLPLKKRPQEAVAMRQATDMAPGKFNSVIAQNNLYKLAV